MKTMGREDIVLLTCRDDVHEYQWLFSLSFSLFLSPFFPLYQASVFCRRLSSLGLATINQLVGLLSQDVMRARGMLAVAAPITGDE